MCQSLVDKTVYLQAKYYQEHLTMQMMVTPTINTHTGRKRSDLDPLIWSQVRDSDCELRLVQQNLYLGATGILTTADANWDHPAGAVLT